MVRSPRKQEAVYEAPEASPVSRVVPRRPISWALAMERIFRAVTALPPEARCDEEDDHEPPATTTQSEDSPARPATTTQSEDSPARRGGED